MTKDHDIEIDSLLRRLAKTEANTEPAAVGHIDADEIAVFAENALPEKARARVISHLSGCARCRTVLSNIVISARGAEPVEQETAAGAAISFEIPWYTKLFSVRGLATALGVLVILMAGFFAVSLFRNLGGQESVASGENANIADAANVADQSAPSSAPSEGNFNATDRTPAEQTLETEATGSDRLSQLRAGNKSGAEREQDFKDGRGRRDLAAESMVADDEDKAASVDQAPASAGSVAKMAEPNIPARPSAPPPPVAVQRAESVEEKAASEARVARRKNEVQADGIILGQSKKEGAPKRQISGKTFEQRDGVWFDAAYEGQPTTNVRRATEAYRALDSGLRQITDKLPGTVVVVWKSKAYRID